MWNTYQCISGFVFKKLVLSVPVKYPIKAFLKNTAALQTHCHQDLDRWHEIYWTWNIFIYEILYHILLGLYFWVATFHYVFNYFVKYWLVLYCLLHFISRGFFILGRNLRPFSCFTKKIRNLQFYFLSHKVLS